MIFKRRFQILTFVWLVLAANMASASIPLPILEYLFNEEGVFVSSTGSDKTHLRFQSREGLVDLHSQGGMGVSGSLGDYCFDNTFWEPGSGNNGVATHEKANSEIEELRSCTWQGWFKSDALLRPGARLFEKGSYILCGWNGSLQLLLSGTAVTSGREYMMTDEWVYFAVTYDNFLDQENVKFYVGSKDKPVKLVSVHTLNKPMSTNALSLRVGAWGLGTAPVRGYLDNIRLFGSKENSSGVLTLKELEAVRIADTLMIPEPKLCKVTTYPTACPAGLENKVSINVMVLDSFSTPLEGIEVSIKKIAGDLSFTGLTAKTDIEGNASFSLSSLEAGKLILEVSISPGHGLTPITLFDKRIQIEFI